MFAWADVDEIEKDENGCGMSACSGTIYSTCTLS